jgi:hypothetical protein
MQLTCSWEHLVQALLLLLLVGGQHLLLAGVDKQTLMPAPCPDPRCHCTDVLVMPTGTPQQQQQQQQVVKCTPPASVLTSAAVATAQK